MHKQIPHSQTTKIIMLQLAFKNIKKNYNQILGIGGRVPGASGEGGAWPWPEPNQQDQWGVRATKQP